MAGVTPGVLTLHPLQDAKIWQFDRTKNFGKEHDLVVAPSASGYAINNESRTLIQFDLMQIPAGTSVAKATLRLCVWEYHGDQMGVVLYRITQPWREDTVTWESHFLHYGFEVTRTTLKPPLAPDSWVELDVTTDVRNALAIGSLHHGWMLIAGAGTYARYTSAKFWSREGGVPDPFAVPGTSPATDRRPQLVITTGAPGAPPTGTRILDHAMAKDVQKTYPYDPIDRTNVFTTEDKKAVSWVKIRGPLYDRVRVVWEWWYHSPAGPSRYMTHSTLTPHPRQYGRSHWDWYAVWHEIRIRGTMVARLPRPSQWEVRIFIDGNYELSQWFTITDP
ncbi:MAG: DNRLRE domain-containing protein [Candidatus Bipolaricaulota bacterium]|nr:DNRLRE domain-containing protein [Candidatus Bipolaricaulota bacterium]